MKKIIGILLTGAMLTAALTGCGNESANTNSNSLQTSSATVSTDGSTSMEKVIGYLSEAYMADNTNTKITYNPTGSGAGIQAVSEGRCDIGLSSRDLKAEEAQNLNATVIAIDGIAMIANPQNSVSDLTIEQIAKIYTGEVTNWNEVGGNDAPIVLIGREAASGTRDGFESITKTKDKCQYTQELTSTGDVVQTVSSNPNAIGYASLASVKDTVKLLSVEGVTPTNETIQNGTYKIQRDFVFVTPKNKRLSEATQAFMDYASSAEADEMITKAGAVPIKR